MPRPKSRLTLAKNCKRAGMTRDQVLELVTKTATETAKREGWRNSELAFALADWHNVLDKVYRKKKGA